MKNKYGTIKTTLKLFAIKVLFTLVVYQLALEQ